MISRSAVPTMWLTTDERAQAGLWDALARLPRGSGVVFRHYATPEVERRALLQRVAVIARRRGLVLVVAGESFGLRAGRHGRRAASGLSTRSAHSRRELVAAARAGADAVFVSPVFPTRSHPGASALGRVRLGLMIRGIDIPVITLGGMTPARARSLTRLRVHGWAAIDAWSAPTPNQKRNAVPT